MSWKSKANGNMSREESTCQRISPKWLEDTRAELERRIEVLENTQRDVNARLEKLENTVEQSLASVHCCIDSLLLNLAEKEKEEREEKKEGKLPAQIKKEADTNATDFPVHLAVQNGDLAAVKALVLAGTEAFARNASGESALQIAAAGGHSEIVSLLLRQYSDTQDGLSLVDAQEHLEEALMCAANWSVAKMLIGKVGRCATAAVLRRAASEGRLPVLCDLLCSGIDPNAVDANGWSALHLAAGKGQTECVKALLESCAKPGYVGGPKMQTPLHMAAEKGHADCLEALLVRGPNTINVRDQHGWSPLHYAANGMWPECVKVLLQHNSNIAATNNRGETALHLASCLSAAEREAKDDAPTTLARRKQVLEFLLIAGADPNVRGDDTRTPFDLDGAEALREVMG